MITLTPTDRHELIAKYRPLAKKLASRRAYHYPWLKDDIHAAASLGLVEAARNYDQDKSKLATFAWFRIRGAIHDFIKREHKHYDPVEAGASVDWVLGPGDHVADTGSIDRVISLVSKLPRHISAVLYLIYVHGYTDSMVGQRLGISASEATRRGNIGINMPRDYVQDPKAAVPKDRTVSKEHRKKISAANRGKKHSYDRIQRTIAGRGPVKQSTKDKISEMMTGRKYPIERVLNMIDAKLEKGTLYKGHPISEETRRKISQAKRGKGQSHSEHTRAKMSATRKKLAQDPVERRKLVERLHGPVDKEEEV